MIFLPLIVIALSLVPPLAAQEVLRGEVKVDLEPVYAAYLDAPFPLDTASAHKRALEEAALFYSGIIYGWSFVYDIGERARGIAEELELTPLGTITWGDPGLFATDTEVRNNQFHLWTDYRLTDTQKRRLSMWKSGTVRSTQAIGCGPLGGPVEMADWITIKQTALEDAARAAIRAILRGSERNRPKQAKGFISLSAFPYYYMEGGRWTASGRFRVEITEIIPFAAY
jgi:hypothetical protein